MHESAAIGGWDSPRKTWNLILSYKTEMKMISLLDSFC